MEINEAWRVLSDPMLRHSYDAGLDSVFRSESSGGHGGRPTWGASGPAFGGSRSASATPARFPWRFVLGFFIVAVAVILFMGIITDPGQPTRIDNVIRVGSCVNVDLARREAWEVSCDGPHDAQVAQLVPFDAACPSTAAAYRDRQGLGQVCVLDS